MFTGIIEELGQVKRIKTSFAISNIQILAPRVAQDLKIGDSVAVNGVCLTAVEVAADSFLADVMPETLKKSNLCELGSGDKVNLERALMLSDRLSGHFVLGHVDEVGIILDKRREGNSLLFKISISSEIADYVVAKGSITVDGISLTIVDVESNSLTVSIIPHTAEATTLGFRLRGAKVNLEADIIGKYVQKMAKADKESRSTLALLHKYGYIDQGGV